VRQVRDRAGARARRRVRARLTGRADARPGRQARHRRRLRAVRLFARRALPDRGIDWASLVAAFLFQLAWLLALYAIFGRGFTLDGSGIAYVLGMTAIELLKAVLWLLIVVVIVQAVLSWVAPDGPLAGLLNALTFPFLRPLRRYIPPIGGTLDLTPLILIVILQLALMLPVRWLEQALFTTLR
jgi:YggT family protein